MSRMAGQATILSQDVGFCEGPVIAGNGDTFAVAIDRGQITRTTRAGETTVWATTGGGPNGLTADGQGGLFVAQNGGIWPATQQGTAGVQHIGADGTLRQLCAGMVAPNDLAIGPDGMLYVTDPTRTPARDDGRIWRVDPATGQAEVWMRMGWYPNGIGFGPDPGWLYVADTGNGRILRIPLDHPEEARMEVAFALRHGLPDGFAFDRAGRIVTASIGAAEGDSGCLEIFDPRDGSASRIDCQGARFLTNVAIGADGRRVIADSGNGRLLTHDGGVPGLPLYPLRKA
ncbi:SMP-30/gluconolactonase/LRE family protein [Gemmobacter sp.]|uniref:SMP-30/gluconolactonase/LRE family protein n=1 Tax=Gemmobacter sp. TaxID=1898957 RepID=UPI002AFDF7DF|nr:SMP-30/gluconolactonase/LRE family protein [Gemmobacter sp.]